MLKDSRVLEGLSALELFRSKLGGGGGGTEKQVKRRTWEGELTYRGSKGSPLDGQHREEKERILKKRKKKKNL